MRKLEWRKSIAGNRGVETADHCKKIHTVVEESVAPSKRPTTWARVVTQIWKGWNSPEKEA